MVRSPLSMREWRRAHYVIRMGSGEKRDSHLFLGRQGLLVYINTAIVTHTGLTTITCMRTFCSLLPVGSRSRLRSYITTENNYVTLKLMQYCPWSL